MPKDPNQQPTLCFNLLVLGFLGMSSISGFQERTRLSGVLRQQRHMGQPHQLTAEVAASLLLVSPMFTVTVHQCSC